VYNAKYDPALLRYDLDYDNSLDFSDAFRAYARELAQDLVDTHGLRNRRIVEIGCGNGKFLKLICELGANRGRGYDPSFPGDDSPNPGVEFVQAYFDPGTCPTDFDFLCCRHVLEHIENPLAFLIGLSQVPADAGGATMYFEVPNGEFVFKGEGMWDIIYPHVCYFTERSLVNLFELAGFDVLRTGTRFSNQFLFIEARLGGTRDAAHRPTRSASWKYDPIPSFPSHFTTLVEQWSNCLARLQEKGPVGFWGAGAKGTTFLNVVPNASSIPWVIDSNPRKQGMFVPGTGQPILAPSALGSLDAGSIIVLNPMYRNEMAQMLKAQGSKATLISEPANRPLYSAASA
jgi:SAM-dependent methyltransferase